jgi:hypothetical protein
MKNGQGHLVPDVQVKPIDKLRNELVSELVNSAKENAEQIKVFKNSCHDRIKSFLQVAAQDHGVDIKGDHENLYLTSYDGKYRIIRARDDKIEFNESITIARKIMFELIEKWLVGSNAKIVPFVRRSFKTDKEGHLSVSRIMDLIAADVDDPEWKRAVEIIRESIQVSWTKTYIRFYERDAQGKYQQIALG